MAFNLRPPSKERLKVTLEIELGATRVDPQEVEDKLRYLWETSDRATAGFNLLLMRVSQASTWEIKKLLVLRAEGGENG